MNIPSLQYREMFSEGLQQFFRVSMLCECLGWTFDGVETALQVTHLKWRNNVFELSCLKIRMLMAWGSSKCGECPWSSSSVLDYWPPGHVIPRPAWFMHLCQKHVSPIIDCLRDSPAHFNSFNSLAPGRIRAQPQYKDGLFRYWDFHKDKMVMRPSYLYNGNSYTGKMTFLYWNGPLDTILKI